MDIINETKTVKARKEHVCGWCAGIIKKNELYQVQILKDGDIYAWKNHVKCKEIAIKLKMFKELHGDGLTSEMFQENIIEEYKTIYSNVNNGYVLEYPELPEFEEILEVVCSLRLTQKK